MLEKIRIILVNPSHPGNIGASARAMKNMGLYELCLVSPKNFPSDEATRRASGAEDLLKQAGVVNSLEEGIIDCDIVYGTSSRLRHLEKPLLSAAESSSKIVAESSYKSAILFGNERTGLTNEELSLCHSHIVIPTSGNYCSLNLSQAVQIICYSLRCSYLAAKKENSLTQPIRTLATADQMSKFYKALQDTLIDIDFLDPKQPKMLMQRLQRLFNRALLDTTEINILRGILSKITKKHSECLR